MNEQKFRSSYGNNAIILFIVFSLILGLTAYYEQEWRLYLLYPFFFFLVPFLYYSITSYSLSTTQLILNHPFNKKQIDFSKIIDVEIKKRAKWLQLANGQPPIYILVKYNKYDEMEIYPKFPEKFREALLHNLVKEGE